MIPIEILKPFRTREAKVVEFVEVVIVSSKSFEEWICKIAGQCQITRR